MAMETQLDLTCLHFLLSFMNIFGFYALFWVLCAAHKAENYKIFN